MTVRRDDREIGESVCVLVPGANRVDVGGVAVRVRQGDARRPGRRVRVDVHLVYKEAVETLVSHDAVGIDRLNPHGRAREVRCGGQRDRNRRVGGRADRR